MAGVSVLNQHHQQQSYWKKVAEVKPAIKIRQDWRKPRNPDLLRYWNQRHDLFHKFDRGIMLDDESWFSVTPEKIASEQASECLRLLQHYSPCQHTPTVVDAFCGCGGNSIQFAAQGCKVVAIDIDPIKITYARGNAKIYGVSEGIQFKVGDFFHLSSSLRADAIFLSPPWGGVDYLHAQNGFDLETMLRPKGASQLLQAALKVAPLVAFFVPRNTKREQLEQLSKICTPPLSFRTDDNYVNLKLKALTVYYWKRC